jgi:hypothetical protein
MMEYATRKETDILRKFHLSSSCVCPVFLMQYSEPTQQIASSLQSKVS